MSSMFPPQSLSLYPISLNSYEIEHLIPKYLVPFTYLRIIFLSFQWNYFGVSINLQIGLTPYIISSIVVVRYIRLPTSVLNCVGSTFDPLSSFLNFNHVMIGVGATLEFIMVNIFKIACAYLNCEINMLVLDW
jgi:hypothetical protein